MCRYKRSFLDTFMWHSMFKFEFEEIMEEIIKKIMEDIMEEIMDLMENIMEDRVMCLDGWAMHGTKERLVDHIYEFVIIALV